MHDAHRTTPRLVGLGEAAEQLAVSRRTVERLVAEKTIRAVRVGRRTLIEPAELTRFIEKSKA